MTVQLQTQKPIYELVDYVVQTSKFISATLVYSLARQKFVKPYVIKTDDRHYKLVYHLLPGRYLKVNVVYWQSWGGRDLLYEPTPQGIIDIAIMLMKIFRMPDNDFVAKEEPADVKIDIPIRHLMEFLDKPTSRSPLFGDNNGS